MRNYPIKLSSLWLTLAFILSAILWTNPVSAVTINGFQLQDNTLYLNSGLLTDVRRIRVRRDYGRDTLRALGVRAGYARELGRNLSLFGRRDGVRTLQTRMLTEARFLRAGRYLRTGRILKSARYLRTGRYEIGRRLLTNGRANLLFANYGFDANNNFVWSVTDSLGDSVFAMASSKIPSSASWSLLLVGMLGLIFVMRGRTRAVEMGRDR